MKLLPEGPATPPPSGVTVIVPASGWRRLRLGGLFEYRELLYFLVWRDVKVRYKQTALGATWAILQPFLLMVVFSVIFGGMAKMPSNGLPYPIFTFCALLPWQLFAHALTETGNSLVANERLITKVYFPRLVVPLSAVVGGLVDFGVAFVILLAMMAYYGIVPTVAVLALPGFVLLAMLTAFGVGVGLSAMNVRYRDVRYTLPFLTQIWFFATPVVYSSSLVPARWQTLYGLNPMAGVIEGFRWSLLGGNPPSFGLLAASTGMVVIVLIGGLYVFRRLEGTFADVL